MWANRGLAVARNRGRCFVGQESRRPSCRVIGFESVGGDVWDVDVECKQPAEEKATHQRIPAEQRPKSPSRSRRKKKPSASHQPTTDESVKPTRETGSARPNGAGGRDRITRGRRTKVAEGLAPTVSVVAEKPKEQSPATSTIGVGGSGRCGDRRGIESGQRVVNRSRVRADGSVESPLPWMMMAAARQDFGRTPTLSNGQLVTTSAATDPRFPKPIRWPWPTHNPASRSRRRASRPLQQLLILGPMFVTPIVAFVHQVPLIGDIHPIIGYPLGLTVAAHRGLQGDLVGRHRHLRPLLPWQGAALGTRAPTILAAWPGPTRRTTSPRKTRSCQSGHRLRPAAEERLQRRHLGPARRMELGRQPRHQQPELRRPRHEGHHQLDCDSARGCARLAR